MFDAIKPMLETGLINEEVGRELTEAWESRLAEARESIGAQLREEYAQRYEHDKTVMVEALDRMVTESLQNEIRQVAQERAAIVEDRVQARKKMTENATRFNGFMTQKLAEEIAELRRDRAVHNQGLAKLENFVVHALAREITEFARDKRDLVETKVRLIAEARGKLETLRRHFIQESSRKLSTAVAGHLRKELTQLHEDIRAARENNFGRRIFEAFAAEFGATHLNESAVNRELQARIQHREQKLAQAVNLAERAQTELSRKETELRLLQESQQRKEIMDDLLRTLQADRAGVMRDLLESVQTSRLRTAFEKYLPAVLDDRAVRQRRVVTESVVEITGDKRTVPNHTAPGEDDRNNVIDLKRLAGL